MEIKIYSKLAKYYDIIYSTKQYEKECNFLQEIFKKYDVKRILDVACGTGTHAIILAKKGFEVTGVDSAKQMLNIARKKIKKEKLKIKLYQQDMRNLKIKEKFDAAICMFSSFNHMMNEIDAIKAIKSISSTIVDGGIFVLDVPNPNIYLTLDFFVSEGISKDVKIIRISRIENFLETSSTRWNFSYIIQEKKRVFLDFETVELKYYFIQDLMDMFSKNSFEVLEVYGAFDINEKFNENVSRRIILVGKKVKKR